MTISATSVRYAQSVEERTHRFPTSIYWGDGYLGDKMCSIVADSDDAACRFMIDRCGSTFFPHHLQAKGPDGTWGHPYPFDRAAEDELRRQGVR